MISMSEIDRRRMLLGEARAMLRNARADHGWDAARVATEEYVAQAAVEWAEGYVLRGLRMWWAQREYHEGG